MQGASAPVTVKPCTARSTAHAFTKHADTCSSSFQVMGQRIPLATHQKLQTAVLRVVREAVLLHHGRAVQAVMPACCFNERHRSCRSGAPVSCSRPCKHCARMKRYQHVTSYAFEDAMHRKRIIHQNEERRPHEASCEACEGRKLSTSQAKSVAMHTYQASPQRPRHCCQGSLQAL